MSRTTILAVTLIIALALSGCIETSDELPNDFEEYENAYGFSMDLPEGWIKEITGASPREIDLEVYEGDRDKDPLIKITASLTRNPDVEDFVEIWSKLLGESWDIIANDRAEIGGKDAYRMIWISERYEITDVIWVEGRPGEDLFMVFTFRREISSFENDEWNSFIERIVGSVGPLQ